MIPFSHVGGHEKKVQLLDCRYRRRYARYRKMLTWMNRKGKRTYNVPFNPRDMYYEWRRERKCTTKIRYHSREEAEPDREYLSRVAPRDLVVYQCNHCGGYHIGGVD